MNDYQTTKTAALEAFSQHAKAGQKMYVEAARYEANSFEVIIRKHVNGQQTKFASAALEVAAEQMPFLLSMLDD